jgi:hypothetical protein
MQGFWAEKYSLKRSEKGRFFCQKPVGLDLAVLRREATFAFPFWLCFLFREVFGINILQIKNCEASPNYLCA